MCVTKYLDYKKGWDSYDADPPNVWAVKTTKDFIKLAIKNKIKYHHVAPSVMGGIGITIDLGNEKEIFIEIYNDEKTAIVHVDGADVLSVKHLEKGNIPEQIIERILEIQS